MGKWGETTNQNKITIEPKHHITYQQVSIDVKGIKEIIIVNNKKLIKNIRNKKKNIEP